MVGVRGERVNMIKAQSQRSNINTAFLKVEISSQNPTVSDHVAPHER